MPVYPGAPCTTRIASTIRLPILHPTLKVAGDRRGSAIGGLVNEANGLQAEVRIAPSLDQTGGGFDGFAESDVVAQDAQQFSARFVEFNDLKPKAYRVESAR